MNRTEIINALIKKNNYRNYLEIGCQGNVNFNAIQISGIKEGVDPERGGNRRMTSDEYFKICVQKFDIIFIDGLHISPQPYIDIINSLKVLNINGTIVVHDCLPPNRNAQKVPRIVKVWTGNTWKDWVRLRAKEVELDMKVVDTDYGVGIIRRGKQELIKLTEDYKIFEESKKELLNLISIEEFQKLYL